MPDETELRARLREGADEPPRLDADRIIRRARARRRPKRIAAGTLGALAAVAIVVPVVLTVSTPKLDAADMGAAPSAAAGNGEASTLERTDSGHGSLSEDPWPGCHLRLPEGAAVASGVELHLAQAADGRLALTLVNGSGAPLTGVLAEPPTLILTDGERPAGISTAEADTSAVELAPGGSLALTVPVEAVDCDGGALAAGGYDVTAALAIRLADGSVVVATSARTPATVGAAE